MEIKLCMILATMLFVLMLLFMTFAVFAIFRLERAYTLGIDDIEESEK